MNQLQSLKQFTTVVADTGDFRLLERLQPQDATTNPSLILQAVQKPDYAPLLGEIKQAYPGASMDEWIDRLVVRFGSEILGLIAGRVSMEVDARLSFDAQASTQRALRLVRFAEEAGMDRSRILIKLASTWEGIRTAAALEKQGIHCNLTLLFSFCQAVACADAGVQLISPFVGRIYDWHKKAAGAGWDEAANTGVNDPGVQSVTQIYHYYKRHGITTEVMGASFRNTGQIIALAGCDLLTISPALLAQLEATETLVSCQLDAAAARQMDMARVHYDEPGFRYALNADAMGSEKLGEGIRAFAADAVRLEQLIALA
jgi:transaldolase